MSRLSAIFKLIPVCIIRLLTNHFQIAFLSDQFVLSGQLEKKFETGDQFIVQFKRDVLSQVRLKFGSTNAEPRLVLSNNLIELGQTLIAGRGKINRPYFVASSFANHPHREHKSQPGILMPDSRQIEN